MTGRAKEISVDESRTLRSTRVSQILKDHNAELFHDPADQGYVTLTRDGHRETYAIGSESFHGWLSFKLFKTTGTAPAQQALKDIANGLNGQARFEGPMHKVHQRIAWHEGRLYLDLVDDAWRAVEVDAAGWRVVAAPPVYFRRSPGMLPLPIPIAGGRVDELATILNIGDDRNEKLVFGWLLAALGDYPTYPLLVLHGEQGTAKSTLARGLRHLTDPHTHSLRGLPHSERDLAVAGHNNRIVAFDNVSTISAWLSDALCRLASGAGFGTRRNYTDNEEALFSGSRPILLNGIPSDLVDRPDLLERSLVVELPTIPPDKRRPESEVWAALEMAHPRLLGAILTAVSTGIKNLPSVQLQRLPRIADAARWVVACGEALGWGQDDWIGVYFETAKGTETHALENWSVWPLLDKQLDQNKGTFMGTVGDLLAGLKRTYTLLHGQSVRTPADWPQTARKLGVDLKRYTPMLRRAGIHVEHGGHTRHGNTVRIHRDQSSESGAA